jgi:hypothetical protein
MCIYLEVALKLSDVKADAILLAVDDSCAVLLLDGPAALLLLGEAHLLHVGIALVCNKNPRRLKILIITFSRQTTASSTKSFTRKSSGQILQGNVCEKAGGNRKDKNWYVLYQSRSTNFLKGPFHELDLALEDIKIDLGLEKRRTWFIFFYI